MRTQIFFWTAVCGAVLPLAAPEAVFAFGSKSEQSDSSSAVSSSLDSHDSTVWVTRPDGGQQCAPKSGQTLEDSAQELRKAQVRVLNSQKGSDKKLRAQVCGIPTGKTNRFEIPKDDLPKALALGYQQVKE